MDHNYQEGKYIHNPINEIHKNVKTIILNLLI